MDEERYIQVLCDENSGAQQGSQGIGDIAVGSRRLFVNPASDLLKYVRYFAAVKDYLVTEKGARFPRPKIEIELYIHKIDHPITGMYPEFYGLEGLKIYAYRSKKTLAAVDRCLPTEGEPTWEQLHCMYDLTLRLMSQELAVIYDKEMFGDPTGQRTLAEQRSFGASADSMVTLTIQEPLPSTKKLTEALEEHWKTMLHAAIGKAARQSPLPYFEKAFVEIKIVTTKGYNNAKVWDTSNRAIQVIFNNLKGIFFKEN